MAHFARVDKNTNVVVSVHVVDNSNVPTEQDGINYLINNHKAQPWISEVYFVQTSYSSSFREKFAGIGDVYDKENDIFYTPTPKEE